MDRGPKNFLQAVILFSLVLTVMITVIVGVGLATGLLLSWLVPSLEFGIASLFGLIAWAILLQCVFQIATVLHRATEIETFDEDEDDGLSDEQVEFLAEQLTDAVADRIKTKTGWQSPKAKSRPRR